MLINTRVEDKKLLEDKQEKLEVVLEEMSKVKNQEEIKPIIVDDLKYVGVLEIPSINLKLPVLDSCTKENLNKGICLYQQADTIIIGGHNSRNFFNKIYKLEPGDKAYYYNTNSIKREFKMVNSEKIKENEIEKLTNNKYSMILFTCTFDNRGRYIVEFE